MSKDSQNKGSGKPRKVYKKLTEEMMDEYPYLRVFFAITPSGDMKSEGELIMYLMGEMEKDLRKES